MIKYWCKLPQNPNWGGMLFFPCFFAPRIKTSKGHLIKKSGPHINPGGPFLKKFK